MRESLSSQPKTSDSELLLRAWRRWGAQSLDRIDGDFAFALWDPQACELILGRDALGRRPLHLATHDGLALFCSTPLPLARIKGPPRADFERLAGFVGFLPETGWASFFEGVDRVMPGHVARFGRDRRWRQERWWCPRLTPVRISFDAAVEVVDRELGRAVHRAVADARMPVAAQLSGGLDSALVCSRAAPLLDDSDSMIAVTGSSTGRGDCRQSGFFEDEVERAGTTAQALGVQSRVVAVDPSSPLEAAERCWPTAQRPYLNPCNIGWTDATYAEARKLGAEVVLEGMIGNYSVSWDGFERLGELIRHARGWRLLREIRAFRRAGGGSMRGILTWAFREAFPRAPARRDLRSRFLRADAPEVINLLAGRSGKRPQRRSAVRRLTEIEFVDPGLIHQDVEARFGIDLRDPLADRRLVELCLTLPAEHFFAKGRSRRIARALLKGRIPDAIVEEGRRGYQGADWRAGAEAAIPDMIATVDAADRRCAELFDLPRLRAALLNWPRDGWNDPRQVQTYRRDVVRAVCALQWVQFVEGLDRDANA